MSDLMLGFFAGLWLSCCILLPIISGLINRISKLRDKLYFRE